MSKVYKKYCDFCGSYYKGSGRMFCSQGCRANGMADSHRQKISSPIGSKRIVLKGYVEIRTDDGWMREHRHIMECYLGRKLLGNEVVHHKNGNKQDNSKNNLELMTHGEHTRLHHTGLKRSIKTREKISLKQKQAWAERKKINEF